MKVLFGTNFSVQKEIIKYFDEHKEYNLEFIVPEKLDNESLLQYADSIDIMIKDSIFKELLENAKNLKHLQIPWTGSDRVDFKLLKDYPHITVSNSHSNSLTIAEHAVALLLAVAKQLRYRDSKMREGNWSTRYERVMHSLPLTGMTVGIIGYGAIGQKVAKMLKYGFDMKVKAIKRHPDSVKNDNVCDFLGGMEDKQKVISESDFLIIGLPLTPETKDFISKEEFTLMKDQAIIVNIARGPIINEEALYNFLKNKKGFAGIDVWYNYPESASKTEKIKQNFPFEELDNIIMSPHSAFRVADIGMKTAEDIIENLKLVAKGKDPINIINGELGY